MAETGKIEDTGGLIFTGDFPHRRYRFASGSDIFREKAPPGWAALEYPFPKSIRLTIMPVDPVHERPVCKAWSG